MQEASLTNVIDTIFVIIVFYYLFKFLARLFLPLLVKKVVQKAGENFQQQYSQQTTRQRTSNNDEIIIDTTHAKKSPKTKKVGDYVDYEEID